MNDVRSVDTVLIVIDRLPYGDWQGREALDMALSLAAFDQSVAILFRGDGVHWLRPGQNGNAVGQKTVSRNLSAAPLFGVDALYADQTALTRLGLERTEPEVVPVVVDQPFYRRFFEVVQL